jgi:glycosyltransferase involved in cell wall biosynthesis
MKIVFMDDGIYAYASGSPWAVGGAERDQWLLARALTQTGWSVVVAVRKALNLGERKFIDRVEYVGIGESQVLLAWHKFLSAEKPDWLFWECAYHLWGPLVEIAKLTGVKTIFHSACDLDVHPRYALVHRRRWWPLYAWGLLRTDRIFVQHSGQLSGLSSSFRAKARVLPKVCLMESPLCRGPRVKSHYTRGKYVAWVGTLISLKRPDILVEIARKLTNVSFVVCGGIKPGCDPSVIEDLRSTPNIHYLGQVAPDKAQQVIADASVLLSTSDVEGFPNTFVQAWSCGTPLITLKVDPDQIISRNQLGAVSGDSERALSEIVGLLDSPGRREEIAIRAQEYVVKNHSAPAVIKLFEETLIG